MQTISINWWAVLGAVASSFVIGGIWYSPALFLKPWLEMSGVKKADFDAGFPRSLLGDLISSTVTALILEQLIHWSNVAGLAQGLFLSFCIWFGFVAAVQVSSVTFERKPIGFVAIGAAYRLVAIMAMGAILTIWG